MSKLYGVVDGLYYCNNKRNIELDNRIYDRNIPSSALQPEFSLRPVSTKYAVMPILDQRKAATIPLSRYQKYDLEKNFNPGTAAAPWNGFASNINKESVLRNQFFALQNCEQSVYIPPTHSSLYNINMPYDLSANQPYPDLFNKQDFEYFNPNLDATKIGYNIFNNDTRGQLLNLNC
jgi:hypothetical protein